jgi:hypothetical protein
VPLSSREGLLQSIVALHLVINSTVATSPSCLNCAGTQSIAVRGSGTIKNNVREGQVLTQITAGGQNRLYIGGGWVPASDGEQFPVLNPSPGDVSTDVASASAACELQRPSRQAWLASIAG